MIFKRVKAIERLLCKGEHLLLDEFIKAGPDAYIARKARKTPYKLRSSASCLRRPIPTAKEIRMGMAMQSFMGLDEE